MIEKTVLF